MLGCTCLCQGPSECHPETAQETGECLQKEGFLIYLYLFLLWFIFLSTELVIQNLSVFSGFIKVQLT